MQHCPLLAVATSVCTRLCAANTTRNRLIAVPLSHHCDLQVTAEVRHLACHCEYFPVLAAGQESI